MSKYRVIIDWYDDDYGPEEEPEGTEIVELDACDEAQACELALDLVEGWLCWSEVNTHAEEIIT